MYSKIINKIKKTLILIVILISTIVLNAQDIKKGKLILGFSAGPSFANLRNSEAPHKINIYGSDELPVDINSGIGNVENSIIYTDYETSLFKDILYGVSFGFKFEYFISNRLSIFTGINYDKKGIDLEYSNSRTGYLVFNNYFKKSKYSGEIYEEYNKKVVNHYLCFPIAVKYHPFKGKGYFVQGGFYVGKLISSKVDYKMVKEYTSESSYGYYRKHAVFNNEYLKEKAYTNNIDFGLTIGGGYSIEITDKLFMSAEVKLDIGLRKIDAKYNNEYEEIKVPSGSNLSNTLITSTNYHGFNSNAKNISSAILIGVNYLL